MHELKSGKIKTVISKQKQSKHIRGTKEFDTYARRLSQYNDYPSYIVDWVSVDDLVKIVTPKLGSGTLDIKNDGSIQEFITLDDVVGYYFDKSKGEYVQTKRVQIKYSMSKGIHIIPVKEK